jgi:hypothetical protein
MIPDNLSITEIVMLFNEAVVKGLKRGVTNQLEFNGRQMREVFF